MVIQSVGGITNGEFSTEIGIGRDKRDERDDNSDVSAEGTVSNSMREDGTRSAAGVGGRLNWEFVGGS